MDASTSDCPAGLVPVSLVVTVTNMAGDLPGLLDSISRQQLLPSEVILIDLGSSDGSLDALRRWRPPWGTVCRVLECASMSVAAARNIAIESTAYEHVAVLHGAVRLHTEWLAQLWVALESGSAVAAGQLRPSGASLMERVIADLETPPILDPNVRARLDASTTVAFSKRVWDAVGGYPEWLDDGQDEVFAHLLREAGTAPEFVAGAVATWRPRVSLRDYVRDSFRRARAEGKAGLIVRARSIRSVGAVASIVGVVAFRGAGWPRAIAVATLAARVAISAARYRPSAGATADGWVRRSAATVGLVLITDVARSVGYPVGLVSHLRDEDGLLTRLAEAVPVATQSPEHRHEHRKQTLTLPDRASPPVRT